MRKRSAGILMAAVLPLAMLAGCIRPPDYPGMVQIQTNEIAFLVDMTGDGAAAGAQAEVQRKDIPIPGYFVRTGRFEHQGYWRPAVKVIAVSQAPVRLDWTDTNNPIRMVSRESSGFIMPVVINAYIADAPGAVLYLNAFRPISDDSIDWSGVKQRDWGQAAKESAQPLEVALNNVVHAQLMRQLSALFVRTPILNAEVLSKIYLEAVSDGMTALELSERVGVTVPGLALTFDRDIPSVKDWALERYGITVTVIAPGDGVIFDSIDVQRQIDALAAGVMRENTLRQDEINAGREAAVRAVEAEGQARVAQAQAQTAQFRRQLQEIENDRLLAEAQAEAIKMQAARWDGRLPSTIVSQDGLSALGSFAPGTNVR